MIYSLKGILLLNEDNFVVIQCSGVGYKCLTSAYTQGELHKDIGKEITVYTYMNIRQDAIDLFCFSSINELNCFKLLNSVSGVGPKAALSVLSQFSSEQFSVIVSSGDSKSLTSAPGIGSKTAQRIVLELKDKISAIIISDNKDNKIQAPIPSRNISEAVKALMSLGYSSDEVMPIVSKMDNNLSVEQLIGNTLKAMAKGV